MIKIFAQTSEAGVIFCGAVESSSFSTQSSKNIMPSHYMRMRV